MFVRKIFWSEIPDLSNLSESGDNNYRYATRILLLGTKAKPYLKSEYLYVRSFVTITRSWATLCIMQHFRWIFAKFLSIRLNFEGNAQTVGQKLFLESISPQKLFMFRFHWVHSQFQFHNHHIKYCVCNSFWFSWFRDKM